MGWEQGKIVPKIFVYFQYIEFHIKLIVGLEASVGTDYKMDGTERDSASFRGRPDERELATRDIREIFNDRRQRER